jgi:hypothetical protein
MILLKMHALKRVFPPNSSLLTIAEAAEVLSSL